MGKISSVLLLVVYPCKKGALLEELTCSIIVMVANAMTGEDGTFVFEELDPGQYTLSVQKEGYYVDRKSVTAISGETVQTDILLRKI